MPNTSAVSVVENTDVRDSACYVWQAPGKPLSIHLSLDLVERMEREVLESFKAITQRGSEIGGLLLGRMPSHQPVVLVEDYEKVICDYARGPLYLLADPDRTRLEAALERVKAGAGKGLTVVGFFRSNTRKDLALDDEDLALMREHFSEARQVCLLVRPFSMKPSVGGFFIWEAGQMEGSASCLPFPFRRSELSKGECAKARPGGELAAAATAAGVGRADGSPLSGAKPEARVTIPAPPAKREEPAPPPVASGAEVRVSIPLVLPRREEHPGVAAKPEARTPAPSVIPKREPPAPPPPLPPPVAKPEARITVPAVLPRYDQPAPPPRGVRKPEVRPVGPLVSPKRDEAPAPPTRPPARSAAAPLGLLWDQPPPPLKPEPPAAAAVAAPKVEPAAAKPETPPAAPPTEPAKREEPAPAAASPLEKAAEPAPALGLGRRRLPYAIAAAVVLVLIGASGLLYLRPGGGKGRPPAPAPDAASLALRVERSAGQLLLSWNREATLVKGARAAVLSIYDGEHKEDINLDPGQLRSGSIVYAPITNDVSFKLEVADGNGQSQNETVRAIAGRPSPAVPVGQVAPARADSPAARPSSPAEETPARSPDQAASAPPTPGNGAEPAAPAPPSNRTVVPFRTESLAARLSPPPNLPEPPGLEAQSGAAPVRPIVNPGAVPPPPAPAPKPAAEAPAPAVQSSPPPSEPLRVGGNVQQALLVQQVTPAYPPLARQARVSGVVRVEATIGRNGRIVNVKAISGPPLLRQAAMDAVRQWIYKPTTLNGQPVEVVTQIDVTFNLNR